MSEFVSTHALERSIRQMATGGVLSLDQKRRELGYDQLQEIETQLQIPIWGTASAGAAWASFDVAFDVQFVFAPEQRDSPLAVPHFTYGAVVSGEPSPDPAIPDPNNPDSLVAVSCQVVEWGWDLSISAIIGAIIGIGATVNGGNDVRFDGYVHLTFQGYGNVTENASSAGGYS